jgi:hypothetical protein
MNRQRLALFILLIVLVLAVAWSFMSVPRQKTVNTLKYAPGQQASQARPVSSPASAPKPATPEDSRTLRLDLLDQVHAGFKGYRRNIFKPIFVDEVKVMKQMALAVKPVLIPPVAVQVQKPVETVTEQPETPQKVLAKFTFLGFVKKDNRKTIFISRGNEIILVKKGDVFAGNYEAASITDQALTIKVVDSGEQIVIPLLENRPLAAMVK